MRVEVLTAFFLEVRAGGLPAADHLYRQLPFRRVHTEGGLMPHRAVAGGAHRVVAAAAGNGGGEGRRRR